MEVVRGIDAPIKPESVIATGLLVDRSCRSAHLQEENEAFHELASSFVTTPDRCLDRLVDIALRLCKADTVGISVEETDSQGAAIFRWIAIAGQLKHMVGGTTPRNFSPCGICLDTNAPLLMDRLDRAYPYFREAPLPFVEALLIPSGSGGLRGTLWIVAHTDQRKFDMQDVRLMSGLAAFAFGAIYLKRAVQDQEQAAAAMNLAHEINNPLQSALFAMSLLRSEGSLKPESLKLLSMLETEIGRVVTLSSRLLFSNAVKIASEISTRNEQLLGEG